MATPKVFTLPAGSYTNNGGQIVVLWNIAFTATSPVIVLQNQTVTVPSGGAVAIQGEIEDLRGYL